MNCPKCKIRMLQYPHNKLMISCPLCEATMRNPKHLQQISIENGKLIKWYNTQKPKKAGNK